MSDDLGEIIGKLQTIKNNIAGIADENDNSNTNPKPNLVYSFDRFRKFMDNDLIPARIESAMNLGLLMSEQTDLRNKNKTLTEYQHAQLKVIDRIISDFHNKGYTSLRSFQSLDYKVNEKKFQLRFIKYTFMLVSFLFILVGLAMMYEGYKTVAVMLGSTLIIIYFIILYLNIRQNMLRYKYDWEKIYWKPPTYSKKNTCDKQTNNILWIVVILGILSVAFGLVSVSLRK